MEEPSRPIVHKMAGTEIYEYGLLMLKRENTEGVSSHLINMPILINLLKNYAQQVNFTGKQKTSMVAD